MSLDASAAVVNVEVYTTERSHKMKISQNKYLSLIAVFGLIACGNPTMEMPDHESSDSAADSQQFHDSQMVSEDADSSVVEEDSSVMESDASVSDSSDSGSDSSRADAAARETNVLYRTGLSRIEFLVEDPAWTNYFWVQTRDSDSGVCLVAQASLIPLRSSSSGGAIPTIQTLGGDRPIGNCPTNIDSSQVQFSLGEHRVTILIDFHSCIGFPSGRELSFVLTQKENNICDNRNLTGAMGIIPVRWE